MSAAPSHSSVTMWLCPVCLHTNILQHTPTHKSHKRCLALLQLHPPSIVTRFQINLYYQAPTVKTSSMLERAQVLNRKSLNWIKT